MPRLAELLLFLLEPVNSFWYVENRIPLKPFSSGGVGEGGCGRMQPCKVQCHLMESLNDSDTPVFILFYVFLLSNNSFLSILFPYLLAYSPYQFLGKFISYLMSVSMVVSILTITAIGIDRYYAVIEPFSSNYKR